jgi:biopolymer transport protein TolR
MAAGNISFAPAGGRGRRGRRRPVMSDINVTPFVDVMLVLLIVFMVSAPLLTVGVPIDMPQSQAKALPHDNNEPLTVTVTADGQVFLQKDQVQFDDLIPKLKAVADARGGNPDTPIYVKGDKKVDYATMMHVIGAISRAGYRLINLVSLDEQGGQ